MSSGGEGEVDDLMSNLNKITYHEGATRLPTTYSFSDLESVSSYGTLSDIEAEELKAKEEEGSDTPRNGTLRISGEKKEAVVVEKETEKEEEEKKEIDPQVYTKKVILAQSVVRKHQARRKYKQISMFSFLLSFFLFFFISFSLSPILLLFPLYHLLNLNTVLTFI